MCTGAFGLWEDTDNKLHGYFNTSTGGTQYVVGSGTVSENAVNEADLEFDGSHIGVALNGAWGNLVSASGASFSATTKRLLSVDDGLLAA